MNDEELRGYVRTRSNAELTSILTNREERRPQERRRLASALRLRPGRHSRRASKPTERGPVNGLASSRPWWQPRSPSGRTIRASRP